MNKKIDLGLFARLMRLSTAAREDLLEYVGQTSALTEDAVHAAELRSNSAHAQSKTPA